MTIVCLVRRVSVNRTHVWPATPASDVTSAYSGVTEDDELGVMRLPTASDKARVTNSATFLSMLSELSNSRSPSSVQFQLSTCRPIL